MKAGPNREATEGFFSTVKTRQREWGSHGVPRASSIGNDLRQQWFALMYAKQQGTEPRDIETTPEVLLQAPELISGEALWGMAAGNRQEDPIYEVLREQGYLVTSIQGGAIRYQDTNGETQVKLVESDERMGQVIAALKRTGQRPFLTVHIDGIIEGGPQEIPPTLLELKLATLFSFGGMVQHGIYSEKPGFRMQAHVGAGSFELPYARFMIFARDKSAVDWYFHKMRSANPINENSALYVEDAQIDPRYVRMADFRALYLLECVEKETMPAPDPGVDPLNVRIEKNGDMTHLFPCGWCEWKEPCMQEMRLRGININDFNVIEDLRSKADKEKKPR